MTEPQVPKSSSKEKLDALVTGVGSISAAAALIIFFSGGSLGGGLAVMGLAAMGVGLAWATVWMGRS